MVLTIILPLLSFLILISFGRFLGHKGSVIISTGLLCITVIFSFYTFYEVVFDQTNYEFVIIPWIHSGIFDVDWSLRFDTLSVIMLLVVSIVSCTCSFIFNRIYGRGSTYYTIFFLLKSFYFFYVNSCTAENFLQLFVGWEGVGLCSYLLINFWHTRYQANKSLLKRWL